MRERCWFLDQIGSGAMREETREFRLKGLRPSAEAMLVFRPNWIWCNAGGDT